MDKRFKALSLSEQTPLRLAVYDAIAAQPGMPLAEVLTLIRTGLRMTRPEMARLTQLSVRYLQDIEHGQANPSLEMMSKILTPFGLKMGVVLA